MAVMARTALFVLWVASFCTLISSRALGAPVDPSRPITELRLANGTVLHDVKIIGAGSTTVMATWAGGRGTILLSLLPGELRASLVRQAPLEPFRLAGNGSVADAPLDALGLPTWIKLNNGFILRDCTILRWSQDTLTVRYVGGTVPVRFSDIHVAQRSLFESKRAAALEQQARDVAARALQAGDKSPQQIAAESQAQRGRATDEGINRGVETHRLAPGMTMDQVTAIYGEPSAKSDLNIGPALDSQWTYPRGTTKAGGGETQQEMHVHFFDGVLKSWDGEGEMEANGSPDQKSAGAKSSANPSRVPAMTMDEALQTYGPPAKKEEWKDGASMYAVWTYPRDTKSRFYMGSLQEVFLVFQDGVLKSWNEAVPPPRGN
jgi:hypothetical protein